MVDGNDERIGTSRAGAGLNLTLHADRIDIVTHYYPPIGGPGSKKMQTWAAHLNRAGYRIRVFMPTAAPSDPFYDETLSAQPFVDVHRIAIWDPSRRFRRRKPNAAELDNHAAAESVSIRRKSVLFARDLLKLPDHKRLWNRAALRAILAEPQQAKIVVTTSPYDSTHLIGLKLKQLNPERHWVADFRDSWNHRRWLGDYSTPLHRWYGDRLERSVLSGADTLTWFHQVGIDLTAERMGETFRHKSVAIHNGIEQDTIDWFAQHPYRPIRQPVRLLHAGTLWQFRYPPGFVLGLQRFAELVATPVELLLLGDVEPEVRADLARISEGHGGNVSVIYGGTVSRTKVMEALANCTANLVFSSSAREAITSKMFEAVAAQRPLLYFGHPQGSGAEFLRRYGAAAAVAGDFTEAETLKLFERFAAALATDQIGAYIPKLALDEIENGRQIEKLLARLEPAKP